MATMTLQQLIDHLQKKPEEDLKAEVEYIIVGPQGRIISMMVGTHAKDVQRAMKHFK